MIIRLIACILFSSVSYIVLVYVAPDFADRYGNLPINQVIRSIKNASLNIAEDTSSSQSLLDALGEKASTITSDSQALISDTKKTLNHIQMTIEQKAIQVQNAVHSVEHAYNAINKAKDDLKELTHFSGSTSGSGAIHTSISQ